MTALALARGQRVRIKQNDIDVPPGTEGLVLRIHEDSGLPIISVNGRPAAFQPHQLEVMTPAGPVSVAPEPTLAPEPDEPPVRTRERDQRAPRPAPPRREPNPAPMVTAAKKEPAMYNWTTLEPELAFVTFSQRGIRLSNRAARYLEQASFCHVLYDRENGALAIRPVEQESEQTFPVVRTETETLVQAKMRMQSLLGPTANHRQAIRYMARWNDGSDLLIVAGVPFRADGA